MLRIIKPKTKRAKRALDDRAPKLVENVKKTLFLHGTKTSSVLNEVVSDLYHLKKDQGAKKFTKKNANILPFEAGGETSLQFFCQKNDCSLFVYANHSKKRPHNLIIGRTFDFELLDMVELGIEKFLSIKDLKGGGKYAPSAETKPCFVFVGADFDSNPHLARFKSILLDFFRGESVELYNLALIDRVFVCISVGKKLYLRHCAIRLKKSGTNIPKVELIEAGPSIDFVLRRYREPNGDMLKEAMKMPKPTTKKKVKNVHFDEIQGSVGRIYMPKQEVEKMALAKPKGLKRERKEAAIKKAAQDNNTSQHAPAAAAAASTDVGNGAPSNDVPVDSRVSGKPKKKTKVA